MSGGRDYILEGTSSKYEGFLKIDEVSYRVRKFDGTLSETQTREVMRRGDAAAALIYDKDAGEVVLVEQFRVATLGSDAPGEGWLLEIPAGVVEAGETPRDCIAREVFEETGYQLAGGAPAERLKGLERFKQIATILPSPGASAERIYIYFVEVGGAEKPPTAPREQGDIRVVPLPLEDFFARLDAGKLLDAKLNVAAQWLRANRPKAPPITAEDAKALPTRYVWHEDRDKPAHRQRIIGIKTGNIAEVNDVDIWVNSENTDMLMDRFFGRSISATIRYEGAEKYRDGTIFRDTIAEALKDRLGGQIFVRPGTVVVTKAGALSGKPHNVRWIFHVAAVQAQKGRDLYANANVSAECVQNALLQGEALNVGIRRFWKPLRSIVIPLLGAGQGDVRTQDVLGTMIPAAIEFLRKSPDLNLREIYFLAFTPRDHALLAAEMEKHAARLLPAGPDQTKVS